MRWLSALLLMGCGAGSIDGAPVTRVEPVPSGDSGTWTPSPAEDTGETARETAPPPTKPPGATNPGGAPSKRFFVVTAGQSNAGFRIDDGGISHGGAWDWPLSSRQSALIKSALGALDVGDLGDRGTEDELTAVGGCPLMKSTDGGCHFVDDLSSADPSKWTLSDVGVKLARKIKNAKYKNDIAFVSWIQGEAEARAFDDVSSIRGQKSRGGPYDFTTAEQWADHYRDVLAALLRLLRSDTELPKLRMVVQLIANYSGRTDLVRLAQLDAARDSAGAILIGNANPWQHYRPNGDDWSHYSGQAYMDFCLETGRVVALALARAGLADTKDGPTYGDFPEVTATRVSGSSIELDVSNPNGASTLVLPTKAPTQGFAVRVDGPEVAVTAVTLAAPFTLRLTVAKSIATTSKVLVTYGTESARPTAGQAITDDAATACPKEPEGVVRHNMPLTVKLR